MDRPETTLRLLARAREGDAAALDALFARHLPSLQRWASGRLPRWARGPLDTSDLVQDTLLHTLRNIGRFEPRTEGALRGYLRQAVMNRVRDEIRKRQVRQDPSPLDSRIPASDPSPLEQAVGTLALDRYEEALARLSEDDRALLVGRIEFGLSYEELAESTGKPSADAARKAARRALVKLAEFMRHDT